MSVLEIKNLTQFYDERYIFNSANLTVNNGEHIGVVGLNGAGKSTFINIIAGNLSWDEGEVNWLSGIRRGYLDQYATLDGSLTVMEYLQDAFSYLFELNEKLEDIYAKMGEVSDADELDKLINKSSRIQDELTEKHFYDIDSQIKKVANGLGVGAIGYDKLISTLSGGQRAKLMLSKLLLQDLDIMLLDEPFSNLDIAVKLKSEELFKTVAEKENLTAVLVTHDVEEAIFVADEIYILTGSDLIKMPSDPESARTEIKNYFLSAEQRDIAGRK